MTTTEIRKCLMTAVDKIDTEMAEKLSKEPMDCHPYTSQRLQDSNFTMGVFYAVLGFRSAFHHQLSEEEMNSFCKLPKLTAVEMTRAKQREDLRKLAA